MISLRAVWWIALSVPLVVVAQNTPLMAPLPDDPLEVVHGQIQFAATAEARDAALQLLTRARSNYSLQNAGRSAGRGYQIEASFKVDSGGQTEFDGEWQLQETFDPKQGLHWTARTTRSAYSFAHTQISTNGKLYSETATSYIPLRLHEARAALFGSIPSARDASRDQIRTAAASYKGIALTCVLLSTPINAPNSAAREAVQARRWDETEECIDARTGLLQIHSQAPGRYYVYDYSNAPEFAGRTMPRQVTVTEAGKTVSEILVQRLVPIAVADPNLFAISTEMKARGRAPELGAALKYIKVAGTVPAGEAARPVAVFGLVTASGELIDVHSLQPSDLNSDAAVEAVKQMKFAPQDPLGSPPQQHLLYVIENFVAAGSSR